MKTDKLPILPAGSPEPGAWDIERQAAILSSRPALSKKVARLRNSAARYVAAPLRRQWAGAPMSLRKCHSGKTLRVGFPAAFALAALCASAPALFALPAIG